MSKKGTKALASATLMSLVLTTALAAAPVKAAAGQVTRVGEADRYATAAKVATTNWTTSDDVVLVSGEGYADAVSASALAKKLNAPILLTTAGELSTDAKAALETLKAKNIYIVGGNASVSQAVRDDLKDTYSLVELKGANRYETNLAVAKKLVELGVSANNVLVVGGQGFSDALSVAPVAAAKGQILLLANNDVNTVKAISDFVADNKSKVTVVGTKNVISEATLTTLGATRIDGGSDRFDTNLKVLAAFKSDLKVEKLFVANASGDGYADALVASALAGKAVAPLVLVGAEGDNATSNAVAYIKANATKTTDLNVVGGTGVVTEDTVKDINEAVNPTVPGTGTGDATVGSIEVVDLNQFKVVFNTTVDKDTANKASNYQIGGVALDDNADKAVLQSDKRTVLVTLATPAKQYDSKIITVKKAILTKDLTTTIPKFEQSVTFSDTTVPTVKSVTVSGNNKLTVEFSEPVKMNSISAIKDYFKINGQKIGNLGLDTSINGDSVVKDPVTTGNDKYAHKVEFYFTAPLPTGNNTLKISDGDAAALADVAGFNFKETSTSFTVDSVTTKPQVTKVTGDTSGKIYITFDRPMDKATALVATNYKLNDTQLAVNGTGIVFDDDTNDTVVKITTPTDANGNVITTNKGSNVIYVDTAVKDAYGNKVDDDTRVSFSAAKDDVKPTVSTVTLIDSKTIRVKFSEDVKYAYAHNTNNYTLKDSDGTDISNYITSVDPTNGGNGDTDTFDIKCTNGVTQRLTGSKYTLTIKNVYDTASNVMDDYTTTLVGTDDVNPTADRAVIKSGDSNKLVIFFSEAMDEATITNAANYRYHNLSGDTKQLPSDAKITASTDDKSVTVQMPDNYYFVDANGATGKVVNNFANVSNDLKIDKVTVSNAKDLAGNTLDGIAAQVTPILASAAPGATLESKSFKLYYDGDNVKAEVKFNKALDSVATSDFTVAGVHADSTSVSGKTLTLVFKKDNKENANDQLTKIDTIKAQGTAASFVVQGTANLDGNGQPDGTYTVQTTDEAGIPVAQDGVNNVVASQTVYSYALAPKTKSFAAAETADGTITASVTFDENIDNMPGAYWNDFKFVANDGTPLDVVADTVQVNGATVIFTMKQTDANHTFTKIGISAQSTVDIRSLKDGNDAYNVYVPSDDDKKVNFATIVVGQ